MAGLIDKAAELARLDKEIAKREQEVERIEAKFANSGFVDKAPVEVVEKGRAKVEDVKEGCAGEFKGAAGEDCGVVGV